jgi:hypothetical protein
MPESFPPRPRVIGVEELQEPQTYEQALAMRALLIDDVQRIERQLAARDDPEWRPKALGALHYKQGQLRRVKEWLRNHDTRKESEWQLLGRAHALFRRVQDNDGTTAEGFDGEIDALLDAIERVVPGRHLEPEGEEA